MKDSSSKLRPDYGEGPVTRRSMPFWPVGNGLGDPFGPKVLPEISSLQVCDHICWAANQGLIEDTSAHDDDLVPWNPDDPEDDLKPGGKTRDTLQEIRGKFDEARVGVNMITCNLFTPILFRRGGLTNPDSNLRELAWQKVQRTLRIGHFLGAKYFTYWVARDGYEAAIKVPWKNVYAWIISALNRAYDYISGNEFTNYVGGTIEAKPNEPRGHSFLPTTGHALALISALDNPSFWGVNPELIQHEGMTLLDPLTCIGLAVELKKLFFLHFGNQIKGQLDDDYPPLVGPEHLKETVHMFWQLGQLGWKGVVEFDCHMLRCEANPQKPDKSRREFIENCNTALSMSLLLADRLAQFTSAGLPDCNESRADLKSIMAMCRLNKKAVRKLTFKKS